MPYVGSYIWNLRQKVGDARLIIPSVDTVCVNGDGEILMVYNKDQNSWTFPGGAVEEGMSWGEAAAQEALEEANIVVQPDDLVPFASLSGSGFVYEYQDGSVQYFTLAFVCRKFQQNIGILDEEEISDIRWFTVKEVEDLDKSQTARLFFPAYKEWLKTNQFQQLLLK